jgi:hypothetical protein
MVKVWTIRTGGSHMTRVIDLDNGNQSNFAYAKQACMAINPTRVGRHGMVSTCPDTNTKPKPTPESPSSKSDSSNDSQPRSLVRLAGTMLSTIDAAITGHAVRVCARF